MGPHSVKQGLAAALAMAAMLSANEAAAWVPIDGSYPVWDVPVQYRVNQSTIPSGIAGVAVARIDAGFAEWASPDCTNFSAQNAGDTSSGSNYQDGVNVLRWQSGSWPSQLGDVNSVIGVTSPAFNGGQMFDADMIFNNVGFCWNDSGNNGCVDTGSIATHEQGHFLGLGHTNVNGATMAPYYLGGTVQRSIESDDVQGVCALYPAGGQAASSGSGAGTCQICADDSAQSSCSGQYNACGGSQACVSFFSCIQECADDACIDACVNQYPAGADIYVDLIECICGACAEPCAMECGGSSSSSSSGDAAASSGAGPTSSGAGVGGAAAGTSASAGVGAGADDDDDGALKSEDDDPEASSGCGCRAVGGSGESALALLIGSALLAAAARRRRRD